MQITEIKVFPIGEEKLKAFVSVVFDHCFMVNDIKVIQGREGLFISMPSRRKRNGKFKDVAHPLNNETRQMIEGEVLAEYDRVLAERAGAQPAERPPAATSAVERPVPRPVPVPVAEERAAAPEQAEAEVPTEEKSLEEVAEMHLRDSFWTT